MVSCPKSESTSYLNEMSKYFGSYEPKNKENEVSDNLLFLIINNISAYLAYSLFGATDRLENDFVEFFKVQMEG